MTPSGIDPATFRLEVQCLNQLRNSNGSNDDNYDDDDSNNNNNNTFKSNNEYELVQFRNIITSAKLLSVLERSHLYAFYDPFHSVFRESFTTDAHNWPQLCEEMK
jgi:hypothetical protein